GRMQGAIGEAAEGQERGGRKVEVVTIEKAGQVAGCRVVYVAAVAEREVQALLQQGGAAVLTVASREGFGRQGGMVNLVPSGGRIGIELNPGAGERVGIRFSSRLLQLSRLVRTGVAP
ncbi:MAG: YfiR family protein, partial [Acidobacteria bacterium]|nr:YfiR family protein [Acidobacteriota bacterium]